MVDLVEQLVQAALRGEPWADLLDQVRGDVDGAGAALVLEGELVGVVLGAAVVAAARRGAAGAGNQAEGAGEQGAGGGQPVEAGLEHAGDQGGMVGHPHGEPPGAEPGAETEISVSCGGKKARCEKSRGRDYCSGV